MKRYSIAIAGGGSTYTPALLKTISDSRDCLPLRRLVLYDIDRDRQELVHGFARILFREQYPEVEDIVATTDPEIAFADVDFVLMQLRSGGFRMRELDEKIPLRHGLVGQETCGAGGFAYGLRSIPDVIEVVKAVRRLSPDAWILNYSNPAAIVAEATGRVFPGDRRLINICDMPIGILESVAAVFNSHRREFEPRYFGLNHFGWFTHIYDRAGNDILPGLLAHIAENGITPADPGMAEKSWLETYSNLRRMVRDFPGMLPNTYMQYYLYPQKMVKKSDPNYTRANEVMDGREKRFFEELRLINDRQTVAGSEYASSKHGVHGDYIIELANALANNTQEIFLIITRNNGAIRNFPAEAMVEIPCRVGKNGVEPLVVGEIPPFHKGLMEGQYAYEKLTVDAYFEQSYDKALQALTLNRTVTNADVARALLDDLIAANYDYWGKLFR
ncbi:MAG: 6-phospho-alpha-glucosidase [Negativicutes bacterium]|nr:6-phospho-alpha-glucosidase [Negativicutes bacterium]